MTRSPVVVLTALDLEYAAVRAQLENLTIRSHPEGTRFETGRTADGTPIVLAMVGVGNGSAAVLAERAISTFAPKALMFAGVAGALKPQLALGDVVIATRVYAYHGGLSQDTATLSRPRAWDISHDAEQIVRHIARERTRQDNPQEGGRIHFGPIAAGELVLNSTVSAQARWLVEHYNDALAVEMEAAGVAQAAHLNRSLPVVVVRGISDRADGTKRTTDQQNWQPRAAYNAAVVTLVTADGLARDLRTTRTSGNRPPHRSGKTMGDSIENNASGHARVGYQIGTIHGGVPAPADQTRILQDLATLRAEIRQAGRNGQLDPSTFAAAQEQLTVAEDQLARAEKGDDDAPGARTRALLALSKLGGLVHRLTDIVRLVNRLIDTINPSS